MLQIQILTVFASLQCNNVQQSYNDVGCCEDEGPVYFDADDANTLYAQGHPLRGAVFKSTGRGGVHVTRDNGGYNGAASIVWAWAFSADRDRMTLWGEYNNMIGISNTTNCKSGARYHPATYMKSASFTAKTHAD